MADDEILLTREQVAERLHLSPLTVAAMLRDGRLPGFHLGRQWRVRAADLDRYIREQAEAGEAERRQRAARAAGKPPAKRKPKGEGAP